MERGTRQEEDMSPHLLLMGQPRAGQGHALDVTEQTVFEGEPMQDAAFSRFSSSDVHSGPSPAHGEVFFRFELLQGDR